MSCPGRHPEGAAGPLSSSAGAFTAGGRTARAIHPLLIMSVGFSLFWQPRESSIRNPSAVSASVSPCTVNLNAMRPVWRQGLTVRGGIGGPGPGGVVAVPARRVHAGRYDPRT